MSKGSKSNNSENATFLTLEKFAEKVGCDRKSVLKAVQSGRIDSHKNGRIWQIPISMVDVWTKGREPQKAGGPYKQRVISTYEAENRKKVAQAELAEMELAEKKGDLIPKAEVISFTFKATRKIRDTILGVPNRIANELAAEPDPHQVHLMLENALTESLEDLAGMIEKWDSQA